MRESVPVMRSFPSEHFYFRRTTAAPFSDGTNYLFPSFLLLREEERLIVLMYSSGTTPVFLCRSISLPLLALPRPLAIKLNQRDKLRKGRGRVTGKGRNVGEKVLVLLFHLPARLLRIRSASLHRL